MNIRNAQPADLDSIVRINNQHTQWLGEKDQEFFEKYCSMIILAEETQVQGFILLMNQDTPYNSLHFQWFRQRYNKFSYVDRIAVDQEARGRGIGTELYQFVREVAPLTPVFCEIAAENQDSRRFHTKIGFRKVGKHILHEQLYHMYGYGKHAV